MRRKARVTIVSTRKLIMWVYVIPILMILSVFMIFILWAFTPSPTHFVGLRRTAGNLGHVQIRYNLSPYSDAHATLDEHANCVLMDGSVYTIEGDPTNYYYVNCDNRIGYVDERNLRWTN